MSTEVTAYLDNAATTFPKPDSVYVAADRFYRTAGANAGRGGHLLARGARTLVEETRVAVGRWLDVPPGGEVIFQPSATHALNTTILGARLTGESIAYVTPFEHNSVLRPLEHLRVSAQIGVRELPFSAHTCLPDMARVRAQFAAEPPTLLVLSQASNVVGVLLPIGEIAAAARAVNPDVVIIIDGSQAAGLYELDGANLIDALVFSGHKTLYGPYGASGFALYRRWHPLPMLFGGTGTSSESLAMPESGPQAYEAGSQNVWALAGLRAAIEWLEETSREAVCAHSMGLTHTFIEGVHRLPGVQVITPAGETTAVVSFTMSGVAPQTLENALSTAGIAVRSGLHCAPWVHRLLGTLNKGGTVRVSPSFFNTHEDIARTIEIVSGIALDT